MNRVIVFGNDHTNSVGVIQSLGKAGYISVALLYGYRHDFVSKSRYVESIISASDPQSCIDRLLDSKLGDDEKLVIIPCCDLAALTLEKNKDRLSCRFLFEYSQKFPLEYIAKKENQVRLAIDTGFDVPKSWHLAIGEELPQELIFPCLIKPLVSCEGAKSDIRVCRNKEELQRNYNTLNFTKNVLIQTYIERDYEISILGCALTNGHCILPAIEHKLTLYPKYVGLECLANIQPFTDETLKSLVENFIAKLGYVGLFSIEMMHSSIDDKFYFTEVNLRNDGAESFITKYGANLPLNHVEDLLGIPLTVQKSFYPGYYIWEMHHFQSLISGDLSFMTWIKEILKSRGFLMSAKGDMKPFISQFLNPILRKLRLKKGEYY